VRDLLAAGFTAGLALAAFAILFFLYLLSPLYLIVGVFVPYLLYRTWLLFRRRLSHRGSR